MTKGIEVGDLDRANETVNLSFIGDSFVLSSKWS